MAATTLLLREGRCCVGRIAIFLGGIHREGAPSAVYQFPGEGGRETAPLYSEWLFVGDDGRARSVAMAIISLQTAAIMVHKLLTRQPRLLEYRVRDGTMPKTQESCPVHLTYSWTGGCELVKILTSPTSKSKRSDSTQLYSRDCKTDYNLK